MIKTILVFFWAILLSGSLVSAEDEGIMNRLFAPGPLIQGHAQFEGKECLKCHESGKGVPNSKCLECHKEIRTFVDKKSGFHGLATDKCIQCHSDHKGRDFDSTNFDFKAFDHKKTGYELMGKHAQLKCTECHKQIRGAKRLRPQDPRFLGSTATSCKSCHAKDDVHYFKGDFAKKDCNTCHNLENWKTNIKFDHALDAHFKLEGSHQKLSCKECHTPDKKGKKEIIYKWPHLKTAECLSCHENQHRLTLGSKFQNGKCTVCHSQQEWKIEKFDHEVTKYKLRGRHAEIKCIDCHKSAKPVTKVDLAKWDWRGLKTNCLSCHKDAHRYGVYKSPMNLKTSDCLSCHDESTWKEVHDFTHNSSTRFRIEGEHKKLKCAECHLEQDKKPFPPGRNGIYVWPLLMNKTCENCHQSPHTKQFSADLLKKKCIECHVADGWKVVKPNAGFDHAKTRFPLTGQHEKTSCTQCHVKNKTQIFHWESKDKGFCIECHDNVHNKQFDAQFGSKACGECHTTENFTQRLKFDHGTTRYPLKGAHSTLDCNLCHISTAQVFPVKSGHHMGLFLFPRLNQDQCLSCHQDIHKNQLGTQCTSCHSEEKWKPARFDHQTQSQFPLKGKHIGLKCEKCHKTEPNQFVKNFKKDIPLVRFKPVGVQCLSCHKDEHKGHFGSACASCHTEQNWKITKDFHKNFTLTGVHFTLQCTECHSSGKVLSGLSQECLFCHKKDDIHSGTLPECGKCHIQSMWENIRFKHSMTTFPLKGAHRTLQCQSCHSTGVYQGLSTDCSSCHLSDALSATSVVHSPIGNFMDCVQCHHSNSFAW